jgi:hypothetical protein
LLIIQLAMATNDPNPSNSVCLHGVLQGLAEVVLPVCDHAFEIAPSDDRIHDSRGCRALIGDYQGAIEDFTRYVEWTRAVDIVDTLIQRREAWIAELQADRNPFDAETLEALLVENPWFTPTSLLPATPHATPLVEVSSPSASVAADEASASKSKLKSGPRMSASPLDIPNSTLAGSAATPSVTAADNSLKYVPPLPTPSVTIRSQEP